MNGYEIENPGSIVKDMTHVQISGNMIPPRWFKTITKKSGPYFPALVILSEIVYWYKPLYKGTKIKKRFKSDKLQLNYKRMTKKFNMSKWRVRKATSYLANELGWKVDRFKIKPSLQIPENFIYKIGNLIN